MNTFNEILAEIQKYQTIIIHRHQRPDPDAIGSQIGLAELLRTSYPKKNIYQVGSTVTGLTFLGVMDTIDDSVYKGALVIITDTANAPRISDDRYQLADKIIKIDHHPNDEPYGDLIYVNSNASSCSEIIVDFYSYFSTELTLPVAAARVLYAGIVGDTNRFLYPATTSHTLEIAAKLTNYPFDAALICRQLEQMSLRVAKLAGFVYQNIEVDQSGAAKVMLSRKLLEQYDIVDEETAAIVSLPGSVEEVLAWGIFVEQAQGGFRVRLRSKGPIVNTIAKEHHGGGHPLASGANAADLEEVAKIYIKLQETCFFYKK